MNNKARAKLIGENSSGGMTGEKFANMKQEISDLEEGLKTQIDPVAKIEMSKRINQLKYDMTKGVQENNFKLYGRRFTWNK